MSNSTAINTSIHGRRLGLQRLTSGQTGGTGTVDLLVGPEALKSRNTTAETTSANLKAYGVSALIASSAGSSQVYTLDPPIPGVSKIIFNSTNATAFIKTANSETIQSSVGATQHVIVLPAAGHSIELDGLSTAKWATRASTASGISLTNTT